MRRFSHHISLSLALLCAFAGPAAHSGEAADPAVAWAASHSAGSINSPDAADLALQEASHERAGIEQRFLSEEQACFDLFFANACRDKAAERRRVALSAVRKVEVQANAFKRKARVAERDKVLAEKSATQQKEELLALPADAALVEAAIPPVEGSAQLPPEAAGTPVNNGASGARISAASTRAKMTKGEDRSSQIAAYERKVREAEEHKREVARRKAEKEAKRRSKQTPVLAPIE